MLKSNSSHSRDVKNLTEWLSYLETIHSTEIDLGLTRIAEVALRLKIDLSFATVITVAGTNGKGTTCAFLENAFLHEMVSQQARLKEVAPSSSGVAVYSSPHIKSFNERLRINKQDVTDELLIDAFALIDQARVEISLSYYEFTTLAAFLVLMKLRPRVIILEVGLGGRLDATNIIDADVAVITTIDIDHQAFLGNDREVIGFEKAGIMRTNQLIVVGDTDAPKSVLAHAKKMLNNDLNSGLMATHSKFKLREKDFTIAERDKGYWNFKTNNTELFSLRPCFIPRDNVATALMVLNELGVLLTPTLVNELIEITKVIGRTELFKSSASTRVKLNCDVMLDVGHNPQAARYLAKKLVDLKQQGQYEKIHAVVAMLADKDIGNSLLALQDEVHYWYLGKLFVPRAASPDLLKKKIVSPTHFSNCFDNIPQAFKIANQQASANDLILVFGSFFTVSEVRELLI